MIENVKQDWVCIDAGANIGYHTILMARLSREGSVHAFEPTRTFSMLEENVRHSVLSNIKRNRIALGSAVSAYGREKLFRIWGSRPEQYFGQWTTVDKYLSSQGVRRLDFLKVDVDGFDLEVLEGASRSISTHKPVVLVEINHALATRNKTASDVFAFMLNMKYQNVLILDSDNYLFTTEWNVGDPWPRELSLAFDFEDALNKTEDSLGLDRDSAKVSSLLMRPHNNASVKRDICKASGPAWQYCLEITGVKLWGHGNAVEVDAQVLSGQLGVFFTDARGKRILDRERVVRSGGSQKIIFKEVPGMARSLIFRKTTDDDLEFPLPEIRVGTMVKTINKSSNGNTPEVRHGIR
jgi:FkbM family methyltransferase